MVLFFLVEVGGIEPPSCSSSINVYPTRLVYSFVFDEPYRINNLWDHRNCSIKVFVRRNRFLPGSICLFDTPKTKDTNLKFSRRGGAIS